MALNRYIIRKKWWIGKKKGFLNETGGFEKKWACLKYKIVIYYTIYV